MYLYADAQKTHYSREKAWKNQPDIPIHFQYSVVNREQRGDPCAFGTWYTGANCRILHVWEYNKFTWNTYQLEKAL